MFESDQIDHLFVSMYFTTQTIHSPVSSLCSILHSLALSKAQALSVCKVLEMIQQCLRSLGQPHLFQPACILFLQELLTCQKDFTRYM